MLNYIYEENDTTAPYGSKTYKMIGITLILTMSFGLQAQGSFSIVPSSFQQEAVDTATMEILYDFTYFSDTKIDLSTLST